MNRDRVFGETLFRVLLRMHPESFRLEYEQDMVGYYREVMRSAAARGVWWRVGFVVKSVISAMRTGIRQRWSGSSTERETAGLRGGRFDTLRYDVSQAAKSLQKQPRFVAAVLLVLALGLGANTAVFGVLNAVLLLPLPYREPDRLVRLYEGYRERPADVGYVTEPAYEDLRENATSFTALAGVYTYSEEGADVTGRGAAQRLRVLRVTSSYLDVLGVVPERGRGFELDEERSGAAVSLVSRDVADRLLGGSAKGTLMLDGVPREVIGVLPAGFEDPVVGPVDVWLPLRIRTGGWESWEWESHWLTVIGRLAPGVSIDAAQADVDRRFDAQATITREAEEKLGRLISLHEDVAGSAETLLELLMAAVGFLVLTACVNVAGLVLPGGRRVSASSRSARRWAHRASGSCGNSFWRV